MESISVLPFVDNYKYPNKHYTFWHYTLKRHSTAAEYSVNAPAKLCLKKDGASLFLY